ncbi:3'(2'),5'-bisphosphate nucleotidase CysQ [Brevundimonas sp.]|uniref:3'(2'),5'-bisphosphate nucleotidase CysQ n=1 Tax=Brevundimonas sp. TaxID=1871086 RepID=UPI002D4D77F5|nr:3'(2'),5'-bisphosphate nucleotidase CysQ [Brevundimonas sp.]HYC97766.1 3'(2'),5'-bisphosphate nucleotidase CysQ [Brevundimonas sp.]
MSDPVPDLAADLDLIRAAALAAGELALAEREAGLKIWSKSGGSPVTSADMAVDRLLREALLGARPDHGWLSEETADTPQRLSVRRIFVVDPIDGTVAYMKGKPWWCIPIAIVEDGRPVAAVIHAPALGETFTAVLGGGAALNGRPITASDTADLDDASVLADARLMEGPHWPEPWPVMRFEKRNAIAYRMALVAAGAFDAAIALTPKWDWDVCAGALIVEEAGGKVSDHHGGAWRFNQADPRQSSLVCSAPALHPLIVRRTAPIPLAPR